MVNEKQPFTLRCSVLYCFQSFLCKNEVGQSQIVQTLLPTSADGKIKIKLTLRMLGNIWLLFCHLLIFYKINFFDNFSGNSIRVSNSLDPDQD